MENEIVTTETNIETPATEQKTEGEQNGLQNEGQETTQEVKTEVKDEPLPKGVQKRIDRAVRQKYEAEARANVLEERIRNIEQAQQRQQPSEPGEPKLDQFDNIEDYVTAKARYIAKQELTTTLTAREKAEADRNAKTAQERTVDNWNKRVSLATDKLPDFGEVVGSSDVTFKDPVTFMAIQESDIGPQIAYYLASNPDEADEIAELTGVAAVRAIGRLEAKLQSKQVSLTKTPAPIKPVGQSAKVDKAPNEMSPAEFAKWRKGHISKRGQF